MTPERWQQIQAVLEAVLQHDLEGRAAALDAACGDDADLRAEVLSLLEAHDRTGLVDELVEAYAVPRFLPPALEGQKIGHYKVHEKLGGGGMGVVYRAYDTKLHRPVALKFLPPHLSQDAARRARFLAEARAAAALEHPHICTIYEIGEHEGRLFIAMPCYEGETLKAKVARGPLPVEEATRHATQIAEALARAHEAGIVHRDVKPANIMVTGQGRVKLLDFGLAKLQDVHLTRTGLTLGTVAYMSPEQTRSETVDHRTDLWGLGVVLYEMLSGRRPFQGAHEQALIYSIRHDEPQPLKAHRLEVPAPLARVVERALQKDPAARYQQARDLIDDLAGRARSARVPSRLYRKAGLFLFGVLLLVTLWLGLGALRADRGPTLDSVAVLPLENHSGNAQYDYLADGLSEELIHTLGQVDGLRVAARTSSFVFQNKPTDVRAVGQQLGVASVLEGSLRASGDEIRIIVRLVDASNGLQLWSATYDRRLDDVLATQYDIAHGVTSALDVQTGDAGPAPAASMLEDPEAYEHYLKGRYFWNKRTSEGLQRAVEHFLEAIDRAPTDARAYAGLADAYCILGFYDWQPPHEAFPKARAAAQRALEIDPELAQPYAALGYIALYFDWDWNESERQFQRALEKNPRYAVAHQWYANYLVAMGRFEESAYEMQQGLMLDPLSLINRAALGFVYLHEGAYEDAIQTFESTLELDDDFVLAYLWLGQTYELQGRIDLALDTLRHAATISDKDPIVVAALARAYATRGDTTRAVALVHELQADRSERYIPSYEIAEVYAALGHDDEAVAWLERAYEERSHSLAFLKIDPQLRSLHTHPGFQRLLDAMGFRP